MIYAFQVIIIIVCKMDRMEQVLIYKQLYLKMKKMYYMINLQLNKLKSQENANHNQAYIYVIKLCMGTLYLKLD